MHGTEVAKPCLGKDMGLEPQVLKEVINRDERFKLNPDLQRSISKILSHFRVNNAKKDFRPRLPSK